VITAETRKWWALGALALTDLAVGLDTTILNVALPILATALHATTSNLQWFADAYNLVFAAMLLPAGLLGDRFGRKKLLLVGIALFGCASAACAFAPSAGALIAARAVLGLGGALLTSLSFSVLPFLFSPEERPRALSVWTAVTAISFPIGPILGGWLLSNFYWGTVFLINVPVTVLALIAVSVVLSESRGARPPRLDLAGMLASSLGLAALTYGVIEAGQKSWGDPGALAAMTAGLLVLVAFLFWQRAISRRPGEQPLLDLTLFRSASFTWGTLLATMVSFAMFGVLFAMPQYFQAVEGTDALGTGLCLLPIIGGVLLGSRLAPRLAARAGARVTAALGFAVLAAGLAIGATTSVQDGYGFAAAWIAMIGVGMGFTMPITMTGALSALSQERSGVGSALIMALRQVGGTIGVALLGSVLNSTYRGRLDLTGLPTSVAAVARDSVAAGVSVAQKLHAAPLLGTVRDAFVHGMDVMLGMCGGLMVLGIVLTLIFLPRQSDVTGEKRAEQVELLHEGVA
jgi:EmrB/QacA subfamily drug resistance transporter